jgi:ABC-2 type transport system ATP-binding protein
LAMWTIIKRLMENGTTILLTTQYLEEADQLADRIVVIDGGKVIAEGTAKELKSKVGKDRLELSLNSAKALEAAKFALGKRIISTNDKENSATVVIEDTNKDVREILDKLGNENIKVTSLAVHKPTLDDVFLSLTGKQKTAEKDEEEK